MAKKKAKARELTFGDIKAGNLTDEERKQAEPVIQAAQRVANGVRKIADPIRKLRSMLLLENSIYNAWQKEADGLYQAIHSMEERPITDVVAYIRDHMPGPGGILFLAFLAEKEAKSRAARERVAIKIAKLAGPKQFVLDAWEARKHEHPSKADFARIIAPEVTRQFGENITERHIAYTWLKGL